MGYCMLPCPCQRLFEECGLEYSQTICAAPQYVTVYPFGTYNACPPTLGNYPDGVNGSIYEVKVGKHIYKVIQNFTQGSQHYYPIYLYKNFDGEQDYFETPEGYSTAECNYYGTDLVEDCSQYVDKPEEFKKDIGEVCEGI